MLTLPNISTPKMSKKSKTQIAVRTEEEPQTEKSSRKVRFERRVQRRYISYVPDEDFDNVWYSAEHISEAHKAEVALRRYVSTDKKLYEKNAEQFYAQGVLTEEQAASIRDLIDESIAAVLREQENQQYTMFGVRKTGKIILNDEKISQVYLSHSQKALVQAQIRGAALCRKSKSAGKQTPEPWSPSLFLKRGMSTRLSSTRALIQKLAPSKPFTSASVKPTMVRCTPPAA